MAARPQLNKPADKDAGDGLQEMLLVYAGQRFKQGGGLLDLFYVLRSNASIDKEAKIPFVAKKFGRVVGGIYKLRVSTTLKEFIPASLRPTPDSYHDKAQVSEWEIEHRMVKAQYDSERLEKSAKTKELACLDPLRSMYQRMFPADRVAMELVILNYLRTGHKKNR